MLLSSECSMSTKYTLQGVCRPELYVGNKNIHVFEMLKRQKKQYRLLGMITILSL